MTQRIFHVLWRVKDTGVVEPQDQGLTKGRCPVWVGPLLDQRGSGPTFLGGGSQGPLKEGQNFPFPGVGVNFCIFLQNLPKRAQKWDFWPILGGKMAGRRR